MLRVAPLYARLDALYDQMLEQVDAILGGEDDPAKQYSYIEEMRRQVGCLLLALGDRKKAIQEDQNRVDMGREYDCDATAPTSNCPLGGKGRRKHKKR